jgi:hypothetical protein
MWDDKGEFYLDGNLTDVHVYPITVTPPLTTAEINSKARY